MANRPLSVTITLLFMIINIVVWAVLGIVIAVDAHPALPDIPQMKGIFAFLSLAMAGILICLFIYLLRQNRTAYYLTLAFFVVTALLTIFDNVGYSDIVVLILNIVPIILLIKDRLYYLKGRQQTIGTT